MVVKIDDIIREHGARTGPVPGNWRRATVVVSRDGLISQGEMDYWNFFAQRVGDRNHTGVLSVDGFGSPFSATGGRVSLSTAIQPTRGAALPETLAIDFPDIGPRDLRGVTLTAPLPTHFATGQTTTVAGHVTATDAVDFNQALMLLPALRLVVVGRRRPGRGHRVAVGRLQLHGPLHGRAKGTLLRRHRAVLAQTPARSSRGPT